MIYLVGLIEIVLNLLGGQNTELAIGLGDDAHLDVFRRHLALKSLPKGEEGGMDGILELHVVLVALLQKGLGIEVVLANGGGLPTKVGAGRVDLKELGGSIGIQTGHEETDAKGSDSTTLGVLLHEGGGGLDELGDGFGLAVLAVVRLGRLASVADCVRVRKGRGDGVMCECEGKG